MTTREKKPANAALSLLLLAAIFCCPFLSSCGGEPDRTLPKAAAPVAELTVHTFDGSYGAPFMVPNFGHSFLSVKNLSEGDLVVGRFVLPPGGEVSVGSWATSAHTGVWYNLESVYYDIGKYDSCTTLSAGIDAAGLDALSAHIIADDRWAFFYNCTAFALDGWNAALPEAGRITVGGMVTPNALKAELRRFAEAGRARYIQNYGEAGYFADGALIPFTLDERWQA
ncbi:MAG: hypothetical protein LBH24_01220 [Clostridiales bacterium]|nr:hypothetical protein [Clostridiales bacterium]